MIQQLLVDDDLQDLEDKRRINEAAVAAGFLGAKVCPLPLEDGEVRRAIILLGVPDAGSQDGGMTPMAFRNAIRAFARAAKVTVTPNDKCMEVFHGE